MRFHGVVQGSQPTTANHRSAATRVVLWTRDEDELALVLPDDAPAGLATSGGAGTPTQPLVEILAVGHGRASANTRNTATAVGARLRVLGHDVTSADGWTTVRVFQGDAVSGLHVTSHLRVRGEGSSLQAWTSVRNDGSTPLVLQAVSSLVIGRPVGAARVADTLSLEGRSEWVGENRWAFSRLSDQDGLVTLDLPAHQHQDARGAHSLVSTGSWSSGRYNPSGVVLAENGPALAWQVEHNGAWRAELGVRLDTSDSDLLVLGLFGPTDDDHAWTRILGAGESFESVPVSLAASGGWQESLAELTRHRRALRRNPRRPVIVFNDYMNTLMGDPTTAKLLPLVDAAARAGAEYFCIDAGWYDDGGDWWDSVGLWEPSVSRFPDGGLRRVVDAIRAGGMVPGLWLEPEVVGVRSPVAHTLPDAAFFQRHGHRVAEWGRYQLDLRHPAAREHLDTVVDRLVGRFGLAYLKLDHNIDIGPGTDAGTGEAPGTGLLEHGRAFLDWAGAVMDRHPGLVVEGCAAGGSRTDPASGGVFPVQSVTDQQDYRATPPIAVAAPLALPPEQTGVWACVDGTMDREQLAFSLVTALLARVHLTGRIDTLDTDQRAVVREALAVYRTIRPAIGRLMPAWPLGLPGWRDPWIVQGARDGDHLYLAVWRRGGPDDGAPDTLRVPLPGRLTDENVEVLYPRWGGESVVVADDGRTLELKLPGLTSARLLRVRVTA